MKKGIPNRTPSIKSAKLLSCFLLSSTCLLYPVYSTAVVPVFQDVASDAGINHGGSGLFGGGASWIDYNNDVIAHVLCSKVSICKGL